MGSGEERKNLGGAETISSALPDRDDSSLPTAKKKKKLRRHTEASLEALKTLVIMFGPREAARQAHLNEDTVCYTAWKRGWKKVTSSDALTSAASPLEQPVPNASLAPAFSPSIQNKAYNKHHSPSTLVAASLTTLRGRSLVGLAKYSAKAAEAAAKHTKPLDISRKAKDISDVHKSIWPVENQNQNILQIGILIQPETPETP